MKLYLLNSIDTFEYMSRAFSERSFFYNNECIDTKVLKEAIGISHIEALNAHKNTDVSAKAMRWNQGQASAFRLNDADAAEVMLNQAFLILLETSPQISLFEEIKVNLCSQLQIPNTAIDIKLSLSDEQAGAGLHFDRWDTIQIHFFGQKEWKIGANISVSDPVSSYVSGTDMEAELKLYCSKIENPSLKQYQLKPGDMFFVPAGIWHQTRTFSSSCSIIIRVKMPAFVDLITSPILKEKLVCLPSWRQRTYGLWDGDCLNEKGINLLSDLAQKDCIAYKSISFNWPWRK